MADAHPQPRSWLQLLLRVLLPGAPAHESKAPEHRRDAASGPADGPARFTSTIGGLHVGRSGTAREEREPR